MFQTFRSCPELSRGGFFQPLFLLHLKHLVMRGIEMTGEYEFFLEHLQAANVGAAESQKAFRQQQEKHQGLE